MTTHRPLPPGSAGDPATPARQFTEPLRELSALGLLAGNAVLQLLAMTGLFFVLDDWAGAFGARSADAFGRFVGFEALGLPMIALLVATHVSPTVRRTRFIVMAVLVEYAASAFFGAITFLGAFAADVSSGQRVFERVMVRIVWLGFLGLACVIAARVWMGLYPAARPISASYGQPYPGQPLIPQPTSSPAALPSPPGDLDDSPTTRLHAFGGAAPTSTSPTGAFPAPTESDDDDLSGWPAIPPPPVVEPVTLEPDPTMRINLRPAQVLGAEETQVVPPPLPPTAEPPAPRTGD